MILANVLDFYALMFFKSQDLKDKVEQQINKNIEFQNREFSSFNFGNDFGFGGFPFGGFPKQEDLGFEMPKEDPVKLVKITKCQYADGKDEKAFKLEAEGTQGGIVSCDVIIKKKICFQLTNF